MNILTTARLRVMKLFVVILFVGLLPMLCSAQATGDLRSKASTAWNLNTTWERYNGSIWVAAAVGEIPNSTTDVLIRNGHTVLANTTAMSCKNLVVGEGLTGVLNISNALTVGGTTTITAGGQITVSSTTGTKFFTGNFINNGTWNNSGNSTATFTGDFTNNGTFTSGSGAYSFSGVSKNITTTNATALTITNISWLGTVTISSAFTTAKPFTVTNPSLTNIGSGMVNNGVAIFGTLAITSGTATVSNSGTITVNTALTGSGTLTNNNGSTLNYGGSGAIAATLAVSTNANLVNYTASGTQTIKSTTYHNLTISGSGTKTVASGGITVNKDLIVSGTAILADGAQAITGNATGTFQLGAGTGYTTTRTTTSWFPTGTPLANYTLDNTSTVTYGAAATLLNTIPATYGHLVFGTGTKTLPASFNITVNGNLTLTTGTLNDNGNTITVKGNLSSTGTHSGAGKILLSGGSAAHNIQSNTNGFTNVELDDAQGATLTGDFIINSSGTFTLTNGVVNMAAFNFYIDNPTGGLAGSGFSTGKMILQSGTGSFVHVIANTGLPITYIYPLGENTGTTEYSPVSITVNANTNPGQDLSFRVVDSKYSADISTDYASRHWTVAAAPLTGLTSYTATFGYTTADIVGTESSFDVFTYNTSTLAWAYIPATAGSNVVTYDGNNTSGISTTTVFTVKAPLSLASTVTIDGVGGSANVYASLTGTTGLFAALNQAVLSGNLTVNVTAASTIAETGAVALNQVNETGAGAGTYTITIQSNNSTQRVFEGTYSVATAGLAGLIRLNGADRVVFNGGTGTDRRLLFRNLSTGANSSVFYFLNDASSNKINNCTIEGSITSNITSNVAGLIYVGAGLTGGTGNDNIVITNNDIKQAGSSTPAVGVSSDGLSAAVVNNSGEISNNKIYNIHRATVDNAAIHLANYNSGWTISGNRIYQDATRTGVTNNSYGILISQSTSNGTLIDQNVIGYAASNATGITSYNTTTSGAARFSGINITGSSTSALNTITGNVIDGISVATTTGGAATVPAFSGIVLNSGKFLVDGNYIGATSGVPSASNGISITTSTNNLLATAPAAIVVNTTLTTEQTISNNHIGAMGYSINANIAIVLAGIRTSGAGNVVINGNEIGNTTANSFTVSNATNGTGAGAIVYGISSAGTGTVEITDNIIQNVTSSSASTTASTISHAGGININGNGLHTANGNELKNISTNSQYISTSVPTVYGISATFTSGNFAHSFSGNTIYGLTNTSAVNTVVTGIYYNGFSTSTATAQINKNFIYNLRSGTGNTSVVTGIHIVNSRTMVSNNRIRLGYDAAGAAITNTSILTGLLKDNTAADNSIYYNSVYIGGTGVGATANNTYAFRRLQVGANDNVRNNIFVNERSNSSGGGNHFAVYHVNANTLTEDYNVLYTPGTGGIVGYNGTTNQASLALWKANTVFDDNSVSADPQFEDATATTPNLKLKTTVPTPAESGAIAISGLTDDFETVNVRTGYPLGLPQGGTAPDMGADEANLIPQDVLPPVISVAAIPAINASCGANQTITITATVTDPSGVASGTLAPTLWWRLSTGTYASLLPATIVGNTYTYQLNLTGIAAGQTYYYYVAAQDLVTPFNIGYSHGAPVHANVSAAPSTANLAPGTFNIASSAPLSGTVTVPGSYATLTGTGGLFEAINTNGLGGNLRVEITNNTAETGVSTLNQVTEYCGTGYTITIVPSSASVKTLSGSLLGMGLFGIYTSRVTIDGNFSGAGRYLKFVNTYSSTGGSENDVFRFGLSGAISNITLKNCEIEGQSTKTAGAVVYAYNCSNLLIDNNLIHGGANWSTNIVLVDASNTVTVSNNEVYNFKNASASTSYGIRVANGNGSNFTISGNSVYNTSFNNVSPQIGISFIPGASSTNNLISGNYIGGSSAQCGSVGYGTWENAWNNGSGSTNELSGITAIAGDVEIASNTMQNILMSNDDAGDIICVKVVAGCVNANIHDNTFGDLNDANNGIASVGGTSSNQLANGYIYGIASAASGTLTVSNNVFSNMYFVSPGYYDGYFGILGNFMRIIGHTGTGRTVITNNSITNCFAFGVQQSGLSEGFMSHGIYLAPTGGNVANNIIEGNNIQGPIINLGDWTNLGIDGIATSGIYIDGSASSIGGSIAKNVVANIWNFQTNGLMRGIAMKGAGNWQVNNNMIKLDNAWTVTGSPQPDNNSVNISGISDAMSAGSTLNCLHNTIYIGGAATLPFKTLRQIGSASFAFGRNPSGTGSTVTIKNNIFINRRTGSSGSGSTHYTMFNNGANAATNWASGASNNNFIVSAAPSSNCWLGYWNSTQISSFATWKNTPSAGYNDANSTNATLTSGNSSATTVNTSELFNDITLGDLGIKTTVPNAPYPYDFVSNKGIAVAVTTDVDGDTRTSTPDIGADEFFICATPVISANTPANPSCTGNDGTIALSGLTASTTYSVTYTKNAAPVAAANYTANGTGVITITGLDGGTYNNIVLTLGPGCASTAYPSSGSITLTNPVCGPNTWQGDVSGSATDWFNAGNWSSNAVPNSCADNVIIPTTPSGGLNFPVINSASAQVGNITLQSGATITVNSSRTLSVCGDFTGSTTSTASTVTGAGKVVLTGNAAQAVSGRTTFSTLHVAKNTGTTATIQANSNIDVTTALELESGTLANSGNLTLKSTATEHAIFNDFGAPVGTYTGSYSGSINEERYYRATSLNSYNQHYMGSPVSNATLAQFGAGSSSGAVTPTADCSEVQLDQTSVYGSVFTYNEANGSTCPMASWTVKAGTAAAQPAYGYSVAKTGSGTLLVSGTPNTAGTYDVTGLTNSNWTKGTKEHSSSTAFGSGWTLVANPYNATLDLTSITPPAGFDNQIQVWDVIQGQYYPLAGTKLIAPFQAFFVHRTTVGGTSTYTINGNWRVATATTFYALNTPEELTVTATNTANNLYDIATVGFNQNATDQFDPQYDANKLTGSIGRHNLSTQNNGYELNTNILSSIQNTSTVNMTFEPGATGNYTLTFGGLNSFDPTSYIMLEDKKLNTMYDVRNGDYSFTADAADDWNRFVLHFTPKAEVTTTDQQCETPGAINITQPGAANWNYTITDNTNNVISTGTLNSNSPISAAAATGTYTLTLTDNNNYQVVKMITVTGTTPVTAAFTQSVNSTTTNTDVAFNSSTQGVSDYYWDFGDGTTATGQNVIHSYSDTGSYTVTLIVIGANGCSNNTTQTITVSELQTGIGNVNGSRGIKIWSNGNRVFVDFSQLTKTDAAIEISNILGQQLVNERFGRNSIYNTTLSNLEATYVIVKVKQGEEITTKKVLITNTK